jgi:hypothetical protein
MGAALPTITAAISEVLTDGQFWGQVITGLLGSMTAVYLDWKRHRRDNKGQ